MASILFIEYSAVDEVTDTSFDIEIVDAVVADFSPSTYVSGVGISISFTDLSTNDPSYWWWDFGDGNTSREKAPTHSYSSARIYYVTLYVSNVASYDELEDSEGISVGIIILGPMYHFIKIYNTYPTEFNENVLTALAVGACNLVYSYHGSKHQEIENITKNTRISDWYKLNVRRILKPYPFGLKPGQASTVDSYEFTSDKESLIGNVLFSDNNMDFPVLDDSNYSTIVNDLLITSFQNIIVDNYSLALSYQQCVFKLLSLYGLTKIPESNVISGAKIIGYTL